MSSTGRHWNDCVAGTPSSREEIRRRRDDGLVRDEPKRGLELARREVKPWPKKAEHDEKDTLKDADEMCGESEARNREMWNSKAKQDCDKEKSDAHLKKALRLV